MKKATTSIFLLFNFSLLFSSTQIQLEFEKQITSVGQAQNIEQGFLYANGNKKLIVPDVFSYLCCKDNSYEFITREKATGKEGYFPIESIKLQDSKTIITKEQLQQGYYKGKLRLVNTPSDWLFGVCSKGAYYFSLKGMFRMIKKEHPEMLKRNLFSDF